MEPYMVDEFPMQGKVRGQVVPVRVVKKVLFWRKVVVPVTGGGRLAFWVLASNVWSGGRDG